MSRILRQTALGATIVIGEQQRDREAEEKASKVLGQIFPAVKYVTAPDGERFIPITQVFTLERLHNEKKRESRQHGYEEGYQAGLAAGLEEARAVLRKFENAISDTVGQREAVLQEAREKILELVIQISRKVTCDAVQIDQDAAVEMIARSIDQLIDRSRITVKVHPDFLPVVEQHRDRFLRDSTQLKELTLTADPRVRQGGCFIETPTGDIDARLESQLGVVEDALRADDTTT